jgi:hypothetical protein
MLPKVPRHRREPWPHIYSKNEEDMEIEEEEEEQQHHP